MSLVLPHPFAIPLIHLAQILAIGVLVENTLLISSTTNGHICVPRIMGVLTLAMCHGWYLVHGLKDGLQ